MEGQASSLAYIKDLWKTRIAHQNRSHIGFRAFLLATRLFHNHGNVFSEVLGESAERKGVDAVIVWRSSCRVWKKNCSAPVMAFSLSSCNSRQGVLSNWSSYPQDTVIYVCIDRHMVFRADKWACGSAH